MRVEILSVGNEVLSGRTLDSNFAFLARSLEAASVQVCWHATVSDSAERIAEALRLALTRADAVILTGGLGPTPDDLTREAVARALGRPLEADEGVLNDIRERLKRAGRPRHVSVESQALLPQGAKAWANRLGTAPAILVEHDGKPVILLPGVPHEMEGLATLHVIPYLRAKSGLAVETFTLRATGVYETQLHERIDTLPDGWPGASLAYLPSWFGVDLRVTISGADAAAVRATAERAREELMGRVGAAVYAEGDTRMEELVGGLLRERHWRIALGESCTGGLVAKRLTDVPGSSEWVERGFVTYSDASKQALLGVEASALAEHGAVSAPVATQMAAGARRAASVEVGIGITGIAGPGGGSEAKPVGTVFMASATPDTEAVRKYRFMGPRAMVRERSAQTALDMVRRAMLGLPLEPRFE